MASDWVLMCFFYLPLISFCSNPILPTVAINSDDHAFVNLKNSNIRVKDLQVLLHKRGMLYHDFSEKSEYINALIESGPLTVGEVKIARDPSLYEELSDSAIDEIMTTGVEMEKDLPGSVLDSQRGIWLVRIEPSDDSGSRTLDKGVWSNLIERFEAFDLNFGRFDCNKNVKYCQSEGWNSPIIALVVPRPYNSTFPTASAQVHILRKTKKLDNQFVYEIDSVVRQVYSLLDGKLVKYLSTREEFDAWRTTASECKVYLVLITNLRKCPFMLSALAAELNYGSYCFAFGPRSIMSGISINLDNQDGAFYVVRSHKQNINEWFTVPKNPSITSGKHNGVNSIITMGSLTSMLDKLLPIAEEELKAASMRPKRNFTSPPPRDGSGSRPPKYKPYSPPSDNDRDYTTPGPAYIVGAMVILMYIGGLLIIFFIIMLVPIYLIDKAADKRTTDEFDNYRATFSRRYQNNIRNRNQSQQQNIWSNIRLNQNELYNNEEFSLESFNNYVTILSIVLGNRTNWQTDVFSHFNLGLNVSRDFQMLLDHYGIRTNEIGYPPYDWILHLPTVALEELSRDNKRSLCTICQYPINSSNRRLCRLPCNCKNAIYHYDCIAPWLIKREDPSSHSFLSGRLHTKRPCPTCRYDITNWGLQQHLHNQ